jgi:hypothetical protein
MARQRYISRNEGFNRWSAMAGNRGRVLRVRPITSSEGQARYASKSVGDWEESTEGDTILDMVKWS